MTKFIHQTDIFHPHGDPDDHWDLATVYSLAEQGDLDLAGIMFDYPPAHRVGDPATLAMAQLGYITGITGVPSAVGSRFPMRDRKDVQSDRDQRSLGAAHWLCQTLEDSPEPVVINMVGSCTDVALAGLLRPDLFAAKCKAIYLNSGAAFRGPEHQLEYNVKLNPGSYAAIFDLPCPIYWAPCWHQTEVRKVGAHGTWYSFVQGEVFSHLSDELCNFFLYMLDHSTEPKYLRYLSEPVDLELKAYFGALPRSMWSTVSILHAAGYGVDVNQGLLPIDEVQDALFAFVPIEMSCADDGDTTWTQTDQEDRRFIFLNRHPECYAQSMTAALAQLLSRI